MTFEGQYLTYAEYQELGGSAIGDMPFNILEFEVRQNIDKYTYGRLKNLTTQVQDVKLCEYKLISLIDSYNKQQLENKGVESESIDGYAIHYATISSDTIKAKEKDIENTIRTYLADCKLEDGTPYLYCGADK